MRMTRRALGIAAALALAVTAVALLGRPVPAASPEVVVYSARHYGQEAAFQAFTKKTGHRDQDPQRQHRRDVRAPQGRGRQDPGRRPPHRRCRQSLERGPGRAPLQGRLPGADRQHPRQPARSREPLVRAHGAGAHDHVQHRQGQAGRAVDLRGPRRPQVEGAALPAPVGLRLQPVPHRHHDQAVRRAPHRGDRQGLGGQPADPHQRRHQDPGSHRGRAVRRRSHQSLLPGPHRGQGPQLPGRAVLGEPGAPRAPT